MATLYLTQTSSAPWQFSEDGSTSFDLVLSTAPAFNVIVSVTLPDGLTWIDGTLGSKSFIFRPSDWYTTQIIGFKAVDDLTIGGAVSYPVTLSFASSDPVFDGLSSSLSVSVIDNDFQRSLEPGKLPSAGNNAIVYDLVGDAKSTTSANTYDVGAGNDLLTVDGAVLGTAKSTLFVGNAGDDRLYGVVQATGDAGNDRIETAASGVAVSAANSGGAFAWSQTVVRAAGGAGNDTLAASGTVNADLAGGSGGDVILGAAGNDYLFGDGFESFGRLSDWAGGYSQYAISATDWRLGVAGNAQLWTSAVTMAAGGADSISAGDGNDYVLAGGGSDTVSGGAGLDTIYGDDGQDAITGGSGNDLVSGGLGNDRIDLEAGDDTAYGGGDNDQVTGGEGNDLLYGDTGDDALAGGEGVDTVYGGEGNDVLSGDEGGDRLYGEVGADSLSGGSGSDSLSGGDGADSLSGGLDGDTLLGDGGNDTLLGDAGDDSLSGGLGDDNLSGGAGNDTLAGNDGADILTGAEGRDTFVFGFSALDDFTDVITDFETGGGGDILDLLSIHKTNITNGNATWPASQLPFTHGYFRILQQGNDAVIGYDRDGHNMNFFFEPIALLMGVDASSLTADNFDFGQENFGLARTGFRLEQTLLSGGGATLGISLWGGQPSSSVTVEVSSKQGLSIGFVTFTPTDWQGVKEVAIAGVGTGFEADRDLVFRIVSTDADYASGSLASIIINDTYVFEKPRVIAPELSIVDAASAVIVMSSNLASGSQLTSNVRLISTTDLSLVLNASLSMVGQSGTLSLPETDLAGIHSFVGFTLVNGSQVNFPVSVNFDNPNTAHTIASSTILTEGTNTSLQVEIILEKPAGEEIVLDWSVLGTGGAATSASDFFMSTLPTGSVSFSRGETRKIIQISLADDTVIETTEAFSVNFSVSRGSLVGNPAPVNVLIRDNDAPSQSALISYWNGRPMDIGLNLMKTEITVGESGQSGFRNIKHDVDSSTLTLEFWGTAADIGQNFDLHFDLSTGVTGTVTLTEGVTGWNVISNGTDNSFDIAGISSAELPGDQPVMLFAITFVGVNKATMPVLSGGVLGESTIVPAELYQTLSLQSAEGQLLFDAYNGTYATDSIELYASNSDLAIDSRDALLALKIANGSAAAADLTSALQITAADINKNGNVSALDAWLLLRDIVGIHSSNVGRVGLVNASADLRDIDRLHSLPAHSDSISLDNSSTQPFVAYIIGDVDGSFLFG